MAGADGTDAVADASQRHMLRRAQTIGLLMRHCVNAVVGVVALLDPHSTARPAGSWLLAALTCWALYRLATRSHRTLPALVDVGLILAVCVSIPLLTSDPLFYASNSAPQAIAGTAVISFAVIASPWVSVPVTVAVAAAYAYGAAAVVGWDAVPAIGALYYFVIQLVTAGLIRVFLLRVSTAVDRAQADRHAVAVRRNVAAAVRDFEREQLSLLHDTAASTLMLVGQGAPVPSARLAAQARRDLDVLAAAPHPTAAREVDVVARLRDAAAHLQTPVRFSGAQSAWLDGETATAVLAAAREVMTNVDRHARAANLGVHVGDGTVTLTDDGVGFDPGDTGGGHGIPRSIVARMARAGGHAGVDSTPGRGTTVGLCWRPTAPAAVAPSDFSVESTRFTQRVQAGFGLALTAYAIVNVTFAAMYAVTSTEPRTWELVLAVLAAVCPLAAVPGLRRGHWRGAPAAAAVLLAVAIAQPLLLTADEVGGQAEWTQSTIGWCVLPLLLGLPVGVAARILTGYWVVVAIVELARAPSTQTLVNVGLGTASIFAVQLISLLYSGLLRQAAVDARDEADAHLSAQTAERVTEALQAEYRARYADLEAGIVPLLQRLTDGCPLDPALRRQAQSESRRLRMLFDQAALFDHPVLQDLRPSVDAADERGVDVAVHVDGALPALADPDRARLMAPLTRALAETTTSARLVLTATGDHVTASIVCEGLDTSSSLTTDLLAGRDDADLVTVGNTVWLTVHLEAGEGSADHERP